MPDARNSDRGYKKLAVWKLASKLSVEIHRMSLRLPKFELYEEGSQIRRSSKSIRSNIVEGYGRRRYKQDFIRFLVFAHASCDETIDHLESLFEDESLKDEELFARLQEELVSLSAQLYRFIDSVEGQHLVRETRAPYGEQLETMDLDLSEFEK